MMTSTPNNFPLPSFFNGDHLKEVYRVPDQQRATAAEAWAQKYSIKPALIDQKQVGLLLIDVQNIFCLSDFELFVSGNSEMGAIEDKIRLCQQISFFKFP